MAVLRGFPSQGIVACFEEPSQTGNWWDIDAPRNAPAKTPAAYLSTVYWHSEFFQYELAMPIQTVTVHHPALAGRVTSWGPAPWFNRYDDRVQSGLAYAVPGATSALHHDLVGHNLGYAPLAFVAWNGRMLMPGVAVQAESEGRNRFIAPYSTPWVVGLREIFNSSANALGGTTQTYSVMVFRVPQAQAVLPLFGSNGGGVQVGRGKVDANRQYLRTVGAGATPFNMDRGPTVDINSGRARIGTGGVVTTEPGYGGAFTAPAYIPVGV